MNSKLVASIIQDRIELVTINVNGMSELIQKQGKKGNEVLLGAVLYGKDEIRFLNEIMNMIDSEK